MHRVGGTARTVQEAQHAQREAHSMHSAKSCYFPSVPVNKSYLACTLHVAGPSHKLAWEACSFLPQHKAADQGSLFPTKVANVKGLSNLKSPSYNKLHVLGIASTCRWGYLLI